MSFTKISTPVSAVILAVIISSISIFIGYQLWIEQEMNYTEGFAGPAWGAGSPSCIRTSSLGAQIYEMLSTKMTSTEEGPEDFREFSILLGKLSCFKRDLLSPGKLIEATKQQPFRTAQDLEPIAETTARCFAKTIPKRDLMLSFDKWTERGTMLLKRLCTSLKLSEKERTDVLNLFSLFIKDIQSVAEGECLKGDVSIAGQPGPRMIGGFEPASLYNLREYKGYY
jgi:hypothetical protein